jgi:single-strand DNA-binding protein
MASVNKVILVGHVGRDPETRFNQSGGKIVNLSVATSESWKDKQSGERKEKTEWHRVVCFNERIADVLEKYVRKGSKVYLEGSLQTRKWTGNDGVEKYTTEVVIDRFRGDLVLLDGRPKGEEPTEQRGGQAREDSGDLSDEIPFILWGDKHEKDVL